MKATKLKISNTQLNVNFDIKYTIGTIVVNMTYASCIYRTKDNKIDIDIHDYWEESIEYMGITINEYQSMKKFKEFHKEMGIDINKQIDDYDDVFKNKSSVIKEIEKQYGNLDNIVK